ncbi:hypothetical protein [Nocardiopsis coralliicola]
MPKPLTERQQRFVFGFLVAVLVAFGLYLSVGGGFGGGDEPAEEREATAQESGAPQEPSPMPTTATEDMDVLSWLPFPEDDMKAAAATALAFSEAYGTVDYTKEPEEYFSSMEQYATAQYAKTLAESSGAGAYWEERAADETVTEGRANVSSVRSFDDSSVVFEVKLQSIETTSEGSGEDIGDFAVTVQRKGSGWEVYDFQPADAGNLGGE